MKTLTLTNKKIWPRYKFLQINKRTDGRTNGRAKKLYAPYLSMRDIKSLNNYPMRTGFFLASSKRIVSCQTAHTGSKHFAVNAKCCVVSCYVILCYVMLCYVMIVKVVHVYGPLYPMRVVGQKYTNTKKKRGVTYKYIFKGYNIILRYIFKTLYVTRRFIFDLITANKTPV